MHSPSPQIVNEPAFRRFFQIRSLGRGLEPGVKFDRHRRKEMPFVHSI
jgi:hypothetical protein